VEHLDALVLGIGAAFDQPCAFEGGDLAADRGLVQGVVRGQVGGPAAADVLQVAEQRVRDQGQLGVQTSRRGPGAAGEGRQLVVDRLDGHVGCVHGFFLSLLVAPYN
jgi:hypothetical protein